MKCKSLLLAMFLLLTGCESASQSDVDDDAATTVDDGTDQNNTTGYGTVEVALTVANADLDIAEVFIYSSQEIFENNPNYEDSDFPVSVPMICRDGYACEGSAEVMAGDERFVVAVGYDNDQKDKIFTGTALVDVRTNRTTSIIISLHDTINIDPANQAPVITGVSFQNNITQVGETVTMTATVEDGNPMGEITLNWTMSDGTTPEVLQTTQSSLGATQKVSWVPTKSGMYGLSISATDGSGLYGVLNLNNVIKVTDGVINTDSDTSGNGDVNVTLDINAAPTIHNLLVDNGILYSESESFPQLFFSDPDNCTWEYSWATSCPADYDDATKHYPVLVMKYYQLTPGNILPCTISVVVTDPVGNASSAIITVFMADENYLIVTEDPTIGQSAVSAPIPPNIS